MKAIAYTNMFQMCSWDSGGFADSMDKLKHIIMELYCDHKIHFWSLPGTSVIVLSTSQDITFNDVENMRMVIESTTD